MNAYKQGILLAVISIAITVSMLQLNDLNILIRLKELKVYLQKQDRSEDRSEHIKLIMRYTINSRIYENRIKEEEAYAIERKITDMTADKKSYESAQTTAGRYATAAAMGYINVLRYLTGKDLLRDVSESKSAEYLHTAYFFERNRYYEKAIEYYEKTLKSLDFDSSLEAEILIHWGFCHAMLSRYDEARKKYLTVLQKFGNKDSSITAAILLRYLEGFNREQNRILRTEPDSLEKSEKLFHLMAYDKTIKLLENLKNDADPEHAARIKFFTARTFEEMGRSTEAVEKYSELIFEKPASRHARLANRRIYGIGRNLKNQTVMKMSAELNRLTDDPDFEHMLQAAPEQPLRQPEGEKISVEISAELLKRISGLADGKSGKPGIQKTRIVTRDGNTFIGTILNRSRDAVLLNTIIGSIEIKRANIAKETSEY